MSFALFSLGEYSNILMMSTLMVNFFLGGDIMPFFNCSIFAYFIYGLKICLFVVLFVWLRAVLPRYRYDQLMELG